MQLEVAVRRVRHEIAAALRIREDAGDRLPLILATHHMPTGEIARVEEPPRRAPLDRALMLERRRAMTAPGELAPIRRGQRTRERVAREDARKLEIALPALPLRRERPAQRVVREIEPGDRPDTADDADELPHQDAIAGPVDLEPGGQVTAFAAADRQVPAADDRRVSRLLRGERCDTESGDDEGATN